MKKYLFSILIVIINICVHAQIEHDSNTVIYSWQLENNFSTPVEVPIDTVLDNFQILYPIYKISPGNSFLGNFGSPYISNVFTDRVYSDDFFFINQYYPYLFTQNNTRFYNTRKPFSSLFYSKGGSDKDKEESFDAFFAQNITSKINFGLNYNLISAKSQYKYLNVKKHSFRILASYTGQKYMGHAVFNLNRFKNEESGGIIDSIFRDKLYQDVKEIPTVFLGSGYPYYKSNAINRLRYYDLIISQRLKLFTLSSKEDTSNTTKKRNIAEPILSYVFKMNRSTKAYVHNPIPNNFYTTDFFNPYQTYDSVANFKISNTLQLEFKTSFRGKIQAGIYGLLGNEIENYTLFSEWGDTTSVTYDTNRFRPQINNEGDTLKGINRKEKLTNTYVKAGLYTNFWNRVQANFSGTLYLIGQKAGQTSLQGVFDSKIKILKHEYEFKLESRVENKYPGYLLNTYYSNHFIWNQSLNPEYRFLLSSKIASPSNKFSIEGYYNVLRNYIYFNNKAQPENYSEILNYFSIDVIKTVVLWKFYFMNELVYQVSENKDILPLPDLIIHNSTYFDHIFKFKLTNGELRAMLGVDVYYNTSFKGYSYMPALTEFYLQDEKTIGNYPLMDAFLNIHLKRTRFFLKLQHFNSHWFEQNYYSAVGYPYKQMEFKFGISWIFYD
jgi:hypothetical protein